MRLSFFNKDINTKQYVFSLSNDKLLRLQEDNKKRRNLVCPNTGEWVQIRAVDSKHMSAHVYYPSGNPNAKSESEAHKNAKEFLYNELLAKFPTASVELEKCIRAEGMIRSWREIDVAMEYNGAKVAYEIQYASTTYDEIDEREHDHAKAGYKTIWIWETEKDRKANSYPFGTLEKNGAEISPPIEWYKAPQSMTLNDIKSFSHNYRSGIKDAACNKSYVRCGKVLFKEGGLYHFRDVLYDSGKIMHFFARSDMGAKTITSQELEHHFAVLSFVNGIMVQS
jgi:hypothetical protein